MGASVFTPPEGDFHVLRSGRAMALDSGARADQHQ
jgi:hypothetical protein